MQLNEKVLRQFFKYLNWVMVFKWKLGFARWLNFWPTGIGRFMVITHFGRTSGKKYQTPVNYTIIDDDIYCVSGFGVQSDWYKNILINPNIEVWLKDGWWAGEAEDISNHPHRLEIMREVLIASGFAAPLFGIHPTSMDENTLDQLTQSYRLIKVNRTRERTGLNGPDEYTWVWPIISVILFLMLSKKKK
jgi:deazaflavin-dependent oxidoreductase (nitroreductase family)